MKKTTLASKPLPDKVPIDMTKYPNLKALGKEGAGPIVSSVFAMLDRAVAEGYHEASEEFFGITLQDLISQMTEAVFDHRGIIGYLPDQDNAEALSKLFTYQINPLYSAFSKTGLMNHDSSPATFEEKFGLKESEFNVKRFFQGLLFYSYYCSLPDLAVHLSTSDYELMDRDKHENIGKLIELRPVMRYQESIGIVPGKLYPETGFFDCGDLKGAEHCHACKIHNTLYSLGEISVCSECKAAFRE